MTKGAGENEDLGVLMRSAQEGDQAAYVRLLQQVAPLARRVIHQRRGSMLQAASVEDLVQDILLSLHAARATYDPRRPFLPWLMAIIHNRLADSARRDVRRKSREILVDTVPETFSDVETNIIESAYGDPEALRNAIQALPEGQRRSIELLKLREMSLKEASAVSGMSVSALKVAVHRAIKTLRLTLTKSRMS